MLQPGRLSPDAQPHNKPDVNNDVPDARDLF